MTYRPRRWPSLTQPFIYQTIFPFAITTLFVTVYSQSTALGQFTLLGTIGKRNNSTNSDFGRKILVTSDATVFVAGTTSPLMRGDEGSFGIALDAGLRAEDVFLSVVRLQPESLESFDFRLGSSKEDHLQAILVTDGGRYTYLAGRTSGVWRGIPNTGQDDLFIVKLNTMSDTPFYDWPTPLILGTIASESVTALAVDPDNDDIIYAIGYTSGSLFSAASVQNSVQTDAIIFSVSASNKTILQKRQFGTTYSDYATSVIISADRDGPLFVSVITELRYGQFALGNFHLYKFSRKLEPLGDMLLRTYSHEVVSSFKTHPMLQNSLFVSGYSWLDEANGYDAFFKRISQSFDNQSMGSFELGIDEVGTDEYTHRFGSHDKRNDFISDMIVHPDSGRLLASGYTAGEFAQGAKKVGETAPFIACVDPVKGSLTDAIQLQPQSTQARMEIAGIALHPDGESLVYVGNDLNEETNTFAVMVGTFGIPEAWRERIEIAPTPTRQPSSVPSPSQENPALSTKGFSMIKVIPPVAGGVGGVIVLIVILIGLRNRFKRRDGEGFSRHKQRTDSVEEPPLRRERVVAKGEQLEALTDSGLV